MTAPQKRFASLGSKLGSLVSTHGAVKTSLESHSAAHVHARYQARAKMKTERDLMKDIPEGGIK